MHMTQIVISISNMNVTFTSVNAMLTLKTVEGGRAGVSRPINDVLLQSVLLLNRGAGMSQKFYIFYVGVLASAGYFHHVKGLR